MYKHKFLYCIKCETLEIARIKFEAMPIIHADGTHDARVIEAGHSHSIGGDECTFPEGWATCSPPEIEQDWIEHVQEPSQEEVDVINENAMLLMADCGLA